MFHIVPMHPITTTSDHLPFPDDCASHCLTCTREHAEKIKIHFARLHLRSHPCSRKGSDRADGRHHWQHRISIHALARGVTNVTPLSFVSSKISIHTPARGVTAKTNINIHFRTIKTIKNYQHPTASLNSPHHIIPFLTQIQVRNWPEKHVHLEFALIRRLWAHLYPVPFYCHNAQCGCDRHFPGDRIADCPRLHQSVSKDCF